MHGMGIVSQFSENLTFDGVRIAPDPASGRTTAAWADCVQASGCRGKVTVKNCVFSGAHDDAINVHGTYLRVVETNGERRELKVRFVHKQTFGFNAFLPGDEVEFVRWDSLATYACNHVVKAEMVDPKTMVLVLESPLPSDIRENDVLENVTWTPEVEIRGCEVRHIPTRGFLITTRREVLIEDNDFRATQMAAVLVGADAGSWFESGSVRDMLIRGNRFHHCGEPVIHIDPHKSAANPEVHRNIRIEGNTFHLRGSTAVGAKSTSGLSITGNRIHPSRPNQDPSWFQTGDCKEVRLEDNLSVE
jgi:polygalacturonase